IVVTNTGNTTALSVVVTDPGVSGISPITTSGSVTGNSVLSGTLPGGLNVGDIAVGGVVTIRFSATVTGTSTNSPYINTAKAKGSNINEASDSARVNVAVVQNNTNLTLTKGVRNLTNAEGSFTHSTTAKTSDVVEYQIVVTNTGSAAA